MTFGFIVDQTGNGNYTTISAAVSHAMAGVTIAVRPGIYIENINLINGINITACTGDAISGNTVIEGMLSISSGTATISNIFLRTNSNPAISVTGTNPASILLESCYLNSTNSNIFINFTNTNSSSFINIHNCFGNILGTGSYWSSTSPGHIGVQSSFLGNSGLSTTPNISTSTSIDIIASGISCCQYLNGSGSIAIGNSDLDCSPLNSSSISLLGTSGATLTNVYTASGTAISINIGSGCFMAAMGANISSSNANYVISGGGTLLYNNLSFPGSCHNVAVSTMTRMGYLG